MNKNIFRIIEIAISMLIGVLIVSYTQDILISIIFIIPIAIAYSIFSKFLKNKTKAN